MGEFRNLLLLLAVSSPVFLLAQTREQGTAQATDPQQPPAMGAPALEPSYKKDALSTAMTGARVELASGDLLEIAVFDTPELNQRVRVNSDGMIQLSLIGEISVRSLSPDELGTIIQSKLVDGHFVRKPQVSVFVAEYAGQMANVTGEVNRPGAYALLSSHRLMDLIAAAGGLSAKAGNEVTLTHGGNSASSSVIDLSDKDASRNNPEIAAGDSITVGQAGIVYVLGDVARSGGFLLDRRRTLSVVQAVALAEGTLPSASIKKVRLIRASVESRQEILLDLKMILKGQSPDPQLQAGDILYIPSSLVRGMGRQSIETILATVSGMAIYSSYHF
jgi:polysaccharide export outer membrane protein